jgi:hypothetical protein
MAVEEVRISFSKVSRCGYYKHGEATPEFGSLADTMAQLEMWSNGLPSLADTKLFEAEGERYPVYLFGLLAGNGTWLISTWNEVPSHEAGVASVPMDSKVGDPKVHLNSVQKNSIPGYATYFWMVPARGVIASLRFKRLITGQAGMADYIGRFMSEFTKYAVWSKPNDPDVKVLGYTNLNDGKPKKLRARFKLIAYPKPGNTEYLLEKWADIKKVVRRGRVSAIKPLDLSFMQNALKWLRSNNANTQALVNQTAYLELEYSPTKAELEAMIEGEASDPDSLGWDDMGFQLKGESSPRWISKEPAAGWFNLDIKRINEEAIDLASLMAALSGQQAEILQLLD